MRYRMEMLDDYKLLVRNVEMDLALGLVKPRCAPNPPDPDHLTFTGCVVQNNHAEEIAWVLGGPNFLKPGPAAIASYEEHHGYPDLKPLHEQPEPRRVEFLLGNLLADTAAEIARAVIEYQNGGLTTKTKEKFEELIGELYCIWFPSRFGSWDAERGVYDPYFAHPYSERPRLSFAAAAQEYGMRELQARFPDASEAALKEILLLPLEMLDRTLHRLASQPSEAFMALVRQAASATAKHKTS
jgi:hypothetical protein